MRKCRDIPRLGVFYFYIYRSFSSTAVPIPQIEIFPPLFFSISLIWPSDRREQDKSADKLEGAGRQAGNRKKRARSEVRTRPKDRRRRCVGLERHLTPATNVPENSTTGHTWCRATPPRTAGPAPRSASTTMSFTAATTAPSARPPARPRRSASASSTAPDRSICGSKAKSG